MIPRDLHANGWFLARFIAKSCWKTKAWSFEIPIYFLPHPNSQQFNKVWVEFQAGFVACPTNTIKVWNLTDFRKQTCILQEW